MGQLTFSTQDLLKCLWKSRVWLCSAQLVCAREILRSAPHQPQRNFLAHVSGGGETNWAEGSLKSYFVVTYKTPCNPLITISVRKVSVGEREKKRC